MSVVAELDLHIHQLDVTTAFLNGDLEETIYVDQPLGFITGDSKTLKCRLQKSLYGLRQAPRQWHLKLKTTLEELGFVQSNSDPALFYTRSEDGSVLHLLMWVDDIVLASSNLELIKKVKADIGSRFQVKDLGEASYFLGMELTRDRQAGWLKVAQTRYITELAERFGLQDAKPAPTPMSHSIELEVANDEKPAMPNGTEYRALIGGLMYLVVCTRPDIAYAVCALARYSQAPTLEHWNAAKRILRYLYGTRTMGLCYNKHSSGEVTGYADADWGGCVNTRKSTTGYVFVRNGGAISWQSKLQDVVALSSVEAEYIAASEATKEAVWLRRMMDDFGYGMRRVQMHGDNQGTLSLIKNNQISRRTKHIDIRYHFVRSRVEAGDVTFQYCATENMLADIFTKPLPERGYTPFRMLLGVR